MANKQEMMPFTTKVPVIMTFPKLLKAEKFKGKPDAAAYFSASFLFNPDSDDLKAMKAIAAQIARAKWPGREFKSIGHWPFKNGDQQADAYKARTGKDDETTRGKVIVNAKSKNRPGLAAKVDGKLYEFNEGNIDQNIFRFYPGVEVVASFNISTYDEQGGGITAYLNSVFSTQKGKKIGGFQAPAAEVFSEYLGKAVDEDPTAGMSANAGDDEIPF